MTKTVPISCSIPETALRDLHEVADQAGVPLEIVARLVLAVEVRRWNRESSIRAQRDAAFATLRKIAECRTGAKRIATAFLEEHQ